MTSRTSGDYIELLRDLIGFAVKCLLQLRSTELKHLTF